ncbi:type VI secretion system baseplate subunit TssK, partial [Pseudomonas mandelii]|uniref:type VI secretion system baseplate subunit TssK n=1 Tax=Pseudomonas mandelii TaxID=75612 RepID=UPI003D04E3C1
LSNYLGEFLALATIHFLAVVAPGPDFAVTIRPEDLAQLERSGGFAFHVSGEFAELELKFWAIRN